jgi:4,5-dihydroxyphthalate decarboxylase
VAISIRAAAENWIALIAKEDMMANLKLRLGCGTYDHTRALADGTVRPDGIELEYVTSFPADTFRRMIRDKEFDVAEMGLTFYLGTLQQPDPGFVAIPVYPIRYFVQSAIFINTNRGIASPRDLIGRRVGELFFYGHDAGTWIRGILSDEYGVPYNGVDYQVGGLDQPAARWDWLPLKTPPQVRVSEIASGDTLNDLLVNGAIDALYSAQVPSSVVNQADGVGYLFEDHEAAGRDYFRRTGIFPIMHIVAVRREVYQANPWIAQSLFEAFVKSKETAENYYRFHRQHMHRFLMIPWLSAHLEENRRLMGDDPWPYGISRNRHALETFLRYHHEHGLSSRRFTIEDLFAAELLGT